MEYLMTYGWAILIMAIAMVALFELNIINPYFLTPKASPGACQVVRPNGPDNNLFVTIEGGANCNGILPNYIPVFNGHNSQVNLKFNYNINRITIGVWVKTSGNDEGILQLQNNTPLIYLDVGPTTVGGNPNQFVAYIRNDTTPTVVILNSGSPLNNNKWHFISLRLNGTYATAYVDGVEVSNAPFKGNITLTSSAGAYYLGTIYPSQFFFNGSISNLQIYNTSLSDSEIQSLYMEGIGGAPVNLENLVLWMPLNGNSNDYSGNMNNGASTNVNYITNWESGYSPP